MKRKAKTKFGTANWRIRTSHTQNRLWQCHIAARGERPRCHNLLGGLIKQMHEFQPLSIVLLPPPPLHLESRPATVLL